MSFLPNLHTDLRAWSMPILTSTCSGITCRWRYTNRQREMKRAGSSVSEKSSAMHVSGKPCSGSISIREEAGKAFRLV
ncbi:hypothetical protein XPN_0231 [Xanthomonas arboricola pv. pruni MAFF 301427]|nr:hypothetical protein XPN_0231 [Xanthomonas arboricola pv. pruni MAFF 301427]